MDIGFQCATEVEGRGAAGDEVDGAAGLLSETEGIAHAVRPDGRMKVSTFKPLLARYGT